MKMEEEDIEGIKYNYKIFFVDGNLFSGKTHLLEEISKMAPDIKVLLHPLPDQLLQENLEEDRPRWIMSYYLNELVATAKKFFKEIKTPKNKPHILIEKSLYHFFALASLEYQLNNMEKVEFYIIKEEFSFLINLVHKYCKGYIQIQTKEQNCLDKLEKNCQSCKNKAMLQQIIDKYEQAYKQVFETQLPIIKVDQDMDNASLQNLIDYIKGKKGS